MDGLRNSIRRPEFNRRGWFRFLNRDSNCVWLRHPPALLPTAHWAVSANPLVGPNPIAERRWIRIRDWSGR